MSRAAAKLAMCIRLARECSRDSWQHAIGQRQRDAYLQTKRESMQDAREWKRELAQ